MAAATARGFRALQERRSLALARFEAAFRKVLDARGSAADVEAESKELVASLQSVNAEIRSLEAKLRAAGAADTAALIARVQDCERDKYKATLELHALQDKYVLREDDEHNPEFVEAYRALRKRIAALVEDINGALEELAAPIEDEEEEVVVEAAAGASGIA